jgi:hypothetical protein
VSSGLGTAGELLGVIAPRARLALAALEYRFLPETPAPRASEGTADETKTKEARTDG